MLSNLVISFPDEWEIDIVLNSDKNIQYPYNGNIVSLNVEDPKNRQNLLYQAHIFFLRTKRLKQLKRENDYKACISFLDSANIANILSEKNHCKTIITSVVHLTDIKDQKVYRYIVFPLVRLLYNRADQMIVQTPHMRDEMISFFKLRKEMVKCIATGIDTKSIKRIMETPLTKEDKAVFRKDRTIITAGRLTNNKGQWHLIRAFSYVKKRVKDANLVIFGEGELREQLQDMIDRLQLSSSVVIRSFDAELDKFIVNSAVFAFPSLYEGVPVALMEAMTCGTACICTAFGAGAYEMMGVEDSVMIRELTEAQNGLLSPLCSDIMDLDTIEPEPEEQMLAEGIERLLLDDEYRNRYASKAQIKAADYDMKKIIDEWIKVIEE